MSDFVRAKDPISGHEYTTSALDAKNSGLKVLEKSAVDQLGRPLPAKPNVGPAPKNTDRPDAGKKEG